MIRDLRKTDGPRVFGFLKTGFPEEERFLGTRPEGVQKIIQRVFRWDTQLVLRLARLFGRPLFRFLVVEEGGTLVATTILSFTTRAGYVSMVMVDPAYRRRGHAQALLERARVLSLAAGRKYIALDVLAQNTPARTLYERIGYRTLRESSFLVREPDAERTGGPSPALRPFRKEDARVLVTIARRAAAPEVEEVLPRSEAALRGSSFENDILQTESAAWVIDRGHGPEAYLGAAATAATAAGHVTDPIIGEGVEAADAAALVRTAVDWCIAHGAPRIVVQAPAANVRGRAALLGGGFHDALALWTLYRTTA
ncbi:MAG: GNAT family N-acetyltransferase [Thermoplasmata archaeon]